MASKNMQDTFSLVEYFLIFVCVKYA